LPAAVSASCGCSILYLEKHSRPAKRCVASAASLLVVVVGGAGLSGVDSTHGAIASCGVSKVRPPKFLPVKH
jgi:hypothetical protein